LEEGCLYAVVGENYDRATECTSASTCLGESVVARRTQEAPRVFHNA
jgi:hypothetical protein